VWVTESSDFTPSSEYIRANSDWLDEFNTVPNSQGSDPEGASCDVFATSLGESTRGLPVTTAASETPSPQPGDSVMPVDSYLGRGYVINASHEIVYDTVVGKWARCTSSWSEYQGYSLAVKAGVGQPNTPAVVIRTVPGPA
jgi:hypothetical protein